MDLEFVIQSDVSQKEENKYRMLTHDVWNLKEKEKCFWRTSGQDRNKDADIENGLEDMAKGKGKLGQSERLA